MANGARTLLLSRWRTGGQTSFDLVREFVQELPDGPASDAWQRAVLLAMDSQVSFSGEPRIKHLPTDEAPQGEPSVLLGRLHAGRQRPRAGEVERAAGAAGR